MGLSISISNRIGGMSHHVFKKMLSLLQATVSRASSRTVMGYEADGVIGDALTLLTVPDNIPALEGGRLYSTYGDEGFTEFATLGTGWSDDLDGVYTHVGSSGDIYTSAGYLELGKSYQVVFEVFDYLSGYVQIAGGGLEAGTSRTANGIYTEEVTCTIATFFRLYCGASGALSIRNISIREVTPTWSLTDANGATLHDVSLSVEDSATNLIPDSEDITATSWLASAIAVAAVQDDLFSYNTHILTTTTESGYTRPVVDVTELTEYTFSFYARKGTNETPAYRVTDAISGVDIVAQTAYGGLINTTEYTLIEVSFTTPIGCTSVRTYPFYKGGIGTLFLGGHQLELGSRATPYISTSGGTSSRAADIATYPTPSVLSSESGAIEMVVEPSEDNLSLGEIVSLYIDGNNYLSVFSLPTSVFLRSRVSGTNYNTGLSSISNTSGVEFKLNIYWDSTTIGVRASESDIDLVAFETLTAPVITTLPSLLSIGNRNGSAVFTANYSQITCYESKEVAGW